MKLGKLIFQLNKVLRVSIFLYDLIQKNYGSQKKIYLDQKHIEVLHPVFCTTETESEFEQKLPK